MRNTFRSTYLILSFLTQMISLAGMILTPIYITPGWYLWSAMFALIFMISGYAIGIRVDEWNKMDLLKD